MGPRQPFVITEKCIYCPDGTCVEILEASWDAIVVDFQGPRATARGGGKLRACIDQHRMSWANGEVWYRVGADDHEEEEELLLELSPRPAKSAEPEAARATPTSTSTSPESRPSSGAESVVVGDAFPRGKDP